MDTVQAQSVARSYLDHIAEEDVSLPDNVERDPVRVRALLASLARNTATLVQIPTLRRDMAAYFDSSATNPTIRTYLDSLQALYVLEEIPAWNPHLRSSAVLRKSPKRMLCDPSLAVAALGATPDTLKADLNTFGFLFEALCLRDLLVLSQHCGAQVAHYRDDSGLEADAVLTMPNGSWAGFEVKLGSSDEDSAAAHLLALSRKLQASGRSAPVALCVIVGVAGVARTRPDGVHVVPVDHLGP
jgi:predicted AAA+ superfamily ATPase